MRVYGWNFRGFREVKVDLEKTNFVVGDNSSGKSSVLHLVQLVLSSGLEGTPALNEGLGVDRYDYFSPFFNYAPVSFGFEKIYNDHRIIKIVTVRKKHNAVEVSRASFFNDGVIYTIVKNGANLYWKRHLIDKDAVISDIMEAHKSSGMKLLKGVFSSIAAPNDSYVCMSLVEESESDLVQDGYFGFFGVEAGKTVHIAPLRSLSEKYYLLKRTKYSSGKHFAALWHDVEKPVSKKYFQRVDEFGAMSGLFDRVSVYKLDRGEKDSPLAVKVSKNGKSLFLNQVGVGISQLIPVLVELIAAQLQNSVAKRSSTVLLQQPELHLHPVAQAELGSYLYDVCKNSVPVIIETHSNYLIDRFRLRLSQEPDMGDERPLEASLVFCFTADHGNEIIEYRIARDGTYLDSPDKYLDFFLSETMRTMI